MTENKLSEQTIYNKRWSAKQNEKGLCSNCKNPKLEYSRYCRKCYFKSLAGSVMKNRGLSDQIENLFESQKGICYLTGRKLTLGVDAGLDHIKPQSLYPEFISDVSNVRWVHKKVNEMKRDLTDIEFIAVCEEVIIHNTDLVDKKGPDKKKEDKLEE